MKLSHTLWTLHGAFLASATDFYVSPCGSDQNVGDSEDKPFRTLTAAQQAVRHVLAADAVSEDITVHLASGTHSLSKPLTLTSADSGKNGFRVNWTGSNATISGGLRVRGWQAGPDGIYSAPVPKGTQSRNLFVGGQAANYARVKLQNRADFTFTSTGMSWNKTDYDFLMTTPGIETAEVRFINSFTDRYAPIQSVGDRELVMKQHAWANQIIGYDTVAAPNADFGVWVQNARALLTEGGEFFLDSDAGVVYYKPLAGEDMASVEAYLGIQEVLVAIGGTYDDPAHDIVFRGLEFAHSTWLKPGQGLGYIDQQTGGYMDNATYPQFEASRPKWLQMPSAIQISAAKNIALSGCTYTQLGAGGVGIGNDANAHKSGVGLGASNVTVADGYFTQVMGNSITAGGIQADAHHPSDPRMVNSHITISGNIFSNNSALFSSTVNILTTYIQFSTIAHNDISTAPYSGICHGYGWGSNDAGGSPVYQDRGLYDYQPRYSTPTTLKNNTVAANLIHDYGRSHTDLGALYTLSRAPGTLYTENYAYDSGWFGIYPDEGSSNLTYTDNVLFSNGNWYAPNDWNAGSGTGNNTLVDNWGKSGDATLVNQPNGTGRRGNTFLNNLIRPSVPTSVPADAAGVASYRVQGAGGNVTITATAEYKNTRTGRSGSLSASGSVVLA
ncbi:pectin lyase fold/virulence factor [Coniochaeta sp. 2T2.1]|nr:pectin lyase fold/virulence factor [Coniochaeta sp. 2T2.1]